MKSTVRVYMVAILSHLRLEVAFPVPVAVASRKLGATALVRWWFPRRLTVGFDYKGRGALEGIEPHGADWI